MGLMGVRNMDDKNLISYTNKLQIYELTTGAQIKLLRKSLKFTQEEFANILGVDKYHD